jgi:uncharacterized membrane protein YraQ (UPF0718 family)
MTTRNAPPRARVEQPPAAGRNQGSDARDLWRYAGILVPGLAAWWVVYGRLPGLARFLALDVLGLASGGHAAEAVEFFLYDTPKVLMLLTLVVFGVGILRTFFTPERTRRFLAGKRASAVT